MESSIKVLSQYRLERAKEDLKAANINHENGMYKAALNRAYYAIFHAMRAVVVLDGFDSSKHSGIIAFFNQHYVKEGIFDREMSKMLAKSQLYRERSDYSDFFEPTADDSAEQIKNAELFVSRVEQYLIQLDK